MYIQLCVALLIEDVTLAKTDHVFIHGRFRGGQTQSLMIDKPQPIALIRKTRPEEELAEPLGVRAKTLYQWGRDGILQTARYGKGKRCLFAPLAAGETIIKGQGSTTPRHPQ